MVGALDGKVAHSTGASRVAAALIDAAGEAALGAGCDTSDHGARLER